MHRSNCTYLLATLALGLATAPASAQCTPTVLGDASTSFTAIGVDVQGTYAYVGIYLGIEVFDVTDPTNPFIVAAAFPGFDASNSVVASGNYLYSTGPTLGFNFSVWEIVTPAPALVSSIDLGGGPIGKPFLVGTLAYVPTAAGFAVIDVSAPGLPTILGSSPTASAFSGIAVAGTVAYAGNGDTLRVFDVSNPAAIVEIGSLVFGGGTGIIDVVLDGSVAYVGTQDSLIAVDVSVPTAPTQIGSAGVSGGANDVDLLNGKAYTTGAEFSVYDISDPSAPTLLGTLASAGSQSAVVGGVAFTAQLGQGLRTVDVTPCDFDGVLAIETVDCPDDVDPVEPGYQVAVEVWMRGLVTAASGFQAFMTYDDVVFSYRGDLSSYTAMPFPLHFQDLTAAEIAAGELRIDGLDMFGGPGETNDSLLATLIFDVDVECSTTIPVAFDLTQPFPSELSFDGDPLATLLTNAPSITVDDTPPTLDPCPANITQASDADNGDGCQGAIVSFTDPGATDNCGGTPSVACVPPSGSFFTMGTTTVTCTATDDCGNESQCTFDVTVTATNLVDVDVELFGLNSPAMRCVYFVLDDCGVSVDVTLDFIDHDGDDTNENGIDDSTEGTTDDPSTSVRAVDTIEVPCGNWTSICAKDEQHTKWFNADLVVNGAVYGLDAGTPLLSLRAGDTDNDGDVDINDATLLIAQFGSAEPAGGCPWNGMRGADFSNDGNVGSEDYSLLSAQWLTLSGCSCTGSTTWTGGTSVATATLEPWIAKRADLNRDGFVDRTDVRIFEAIHGLNGTLSEAMKKSDLLGGR